MSTLTEVQSLSTVKKESVYKLVIYGFLFISYLNAVLRLSPESNLTLFRVLLPLALFLCAFMMKKMMVRYVIIVLVFFVYGQFTSLFISRFAFDIVYFLHYGTLIFIALLTLELIDRFGVQSVYRHLRFVYMVMIGLGISQFVFKYGFPNTFYRNTINIFYWAENDFSATLAAFIPFLLADPTKRAFNRILAFIGIAIIVYNASRIAMLAILFYLVLTLLNRFRWAGYVVSALCLVVLFVIFRDYRLEGNTPYQLLINPFTHIFTLTPYPYYGSIYDRTNALIFGLTELINTWGFGVGPGNGTRLFTQPEYFLRTAQSMHNFVAQVIVEYGWLIMLTAVYALLKSYNLRRRLNIRVKDDGLLIIYLITAALASLSQSEGLFSNYYFFVSVFTSIAYFGKQQTVDTVNEDSGGL